MLKDFFTFRRSDRRGALALLIVGVIVLAVIHFTGLGQKDIHEAIVSEAEADSLAPSPTDKPTAPVLHLQAFDPNTADSATLRSLGLSPFVASNIVKYRRAGGHFRKPTDLARIYGMDSASFNRIQPYIYLEEERRPTLTLPQREGTQVPLSDEGSSNASQIVLPMREDLGGSSGEDLGGSAPDNDAVSPEFFTETLARIYIKQKKYDRALEIIRSLYLNYPEKSIYFADQIRFLEKLVRNNNSKKIN